MGFHPKPEEGSLSIRQQRTLHKKMPFLPPNSSIHFGLQPKPHTTQTTAGKEVTIKALSVLYFPALFSVCDTQNGGCVGDKFQVWLPDSLLLSSMTMWVASFVLGSVAKECHSREGGNPWFATYVRKPSKIRTFVY